MNGLGHADFYFSELMPNEHTAMQFGMSGDFVAKSQPLLRACPTDWQRWNYRSETSKTEEMIEPDMPSMSMSVKANSGCKIKELG